MVTDKWLKRAILTLIIALGILVLFAWGRSDAAVSSGTKGCKQTVDFCVITADGHGHADGVCESSSFADADVASYRVFDPTWKYSVRGCETEHSGMRNVKIGGKIVKLK